MAHVLHGVVFVAGLVLAAVSDSVAWGIVGFAVSIAAAGLWAWLMDRERARWDDRGPRWG